MPQDFIQALSDDGQCWSQSEEDSRQAGDRESEAHHRTVDVGLVESRDCRAEPLDYSERELRQCKSGGASEQRQSGALCQELANHTHPARANRNADGNLTFPRRRAREQEIRNIYNRDQQNESDSAEENQQRRTRMARKALV